jgi:hypothetical protein
MSFTPTLAYNIQGSGNYPSENYISYPLQSYFIANLGPLKFYNGLKYRKKPYSDVANFYLNSPIFNSFFTYSNAVTSQYSDITDPTQANILVESYNTIDFGDWISTPSITLNTSNIRKTYNIPSEFNLFYTTLNQNTDLSYGYLLYPSKLFLNPVSLTQNGNNWNLTTNINVALSSVIGIESNYIEQDAADYHINTYLKNTPTLLSLGSAGLNSSYSLFFDLCANRTRTHRPIINFTQGYKPTYFTSILEPNSILNPDSLVVTFSAACSNPTFSITEQIISQDEPDVWKYDETTHFNNTFVILSSYDIKTKSPVQTFQLYQTITPGGANYPLIDSKNCVLSATLFLNNSNIRYSNPLSKSTYNVHHTTDSILGISYIADCGLFKNNDPISGSLTINSSPASFKTSVPINNVASNQTIVWTTPYPPHYYSYKTKLANSGAYLDSNSLNFYLYSSNVPTSDNNYNTNQSSYYVLLSSYITSDHNILSYSLDAVPNDLIRFLPVNLDPLIAPNLVCSYGPYTSLVAGSAIQTYNLINSPWVPVSAGDCLRIDYPYGMYGQTPLSIRSSLSSKVAGQLDAFNATNFVLAPDYQQNNGFAIDLQVLSEDYNQITLSVSNNVSLSSWPYIDLTYKNICWYYTSDDVLPDLNISLNIADSTGNILSSIQPYQVIPFNNLTWNVNISGYGPNTLTIYVSSSDETITQPSFIDTNPSLFSYFVERQFAVTPLIELDNLNIDRTISLQAQLPINNTIVNIPSAYQDSAMYWTWSFDDITDPSLQPISANYNVLSSDNVTIISKDYTHSTPGPISLLSSINLVITPPQGSRAQNLHNIKVVAHSDIMNPSVIGSYSFTVDDFPSTDIFNADFTTRYNNAEAIVLGNTSSGHNTITRKGNASPGTNLYFKLIPSDVASNLANNNGELTWYYNNLAIDSNSDNSLNFDLSLSATPTIQNNISAASIALKLTNSFANGWTSAHNVSAITYFYAVDPIDFTTPLEFNVFPQFGWIGNDNQLTILDENNYTLINNPSAYDNTVGQTQSLYLSANKNYFTKYNYQSQTSPEIITLPSYFGLTNIGYTPRSLEVFNYGLMIGLTAFNNDVYPEIMGVNYYDLVNINNGYNVIVNQFNITSQTLSAKSFYTSNYIYDEYNNLYNSIFGNLSSLLVYWKLNEESGNRYDSTPNGYTLIDVNPFTPSGQGLIDKGIIGDGSGYLTTANTIPLSGDFTINYWVKPEKNTTGNFQCFAGSDNELNFNVHSRGIYYGTCNNFVKASKFIEVSNDWHMATLTRSISSGLANIYLDGNLVATNTSDFTDYTAYFGLLATYDGQYVDSANNSMLDEFSIYNQVININQISNLYNYGLGITYPLTDDNSYTTLLNLSSLISRNNNGNKFLCAPVIVPYNDLYFSFTVKNLSLDLNKENTISVTQTTKSNGPAVIVGGSITYYLSSQYWVESNTIPYADGTYDIFNITLGDPFIPLQSGAEGLDNFYLYAIPDFYQQIPPSVFDLAKINQGYKGNTNIWSLINP